MKKVKVLLLVVVAFLLGASITSASAVSLPLATHVINNTTGDACSFNTLSSTATNNQLVISNIPSTCFGLPITAQTVSSAPSASLNFTGTITTGTITFSSPTISNPSQVVGVKTLINGWNMRTTWSYNGQTVDPISPNPGTPGVIVTVTWNQTAATQFCANVVVTTPSSTPIPWKADLLYTDPPFNGDTNLNHYQLSNGYRFIGTTPVNNRFTVEGSSSSTNTVSSTTSRTFSICNYNTPPPGVSPTAVYSQTMTTPAASYYVCKTVTVSVTNAPFYVGWESTVDVTDLKNLYLGSGGQVQGPYGGFTRTLISGNTYKITGNGWDTRAVRNNTPVSYQICWG